jgi:hypothetical protein
MDALRKDRADGHEGSRQNARYYTGRRSPGGDYIVDIRNVSELTSSGQDIGAFLLHFTGGAASTDPNGVLKRPFPAPTASLTADG